MARVSRRLSGLLSLCLLLQQFSIGFSEGHDTRYNVQDDTEDKYNKEEQTGAKKSSVIQLLKFIGNNGIKAISYTATGVTLTATVIQAIEGCAVTFPSIKDDFEEFQRLKKEYDDTNIKIRDESRQAKNRQLYANDTFYNYRETRDQLRRINDEAALVLKSMGPEVIITLNNVSQDIEQIMEKANKTNSEVDLLQVDTKFSEGLELALRITFPALALAIPGMKFLWKKHLKKSFIGQKILKFKERFNTRFVAPKTDKARKAVSKIMSRGFLGRAKNFITTKLNKVVQRFAPKFEKVKKVFGKIATGLKGLVKLGGAALAIWTAYETFNDCKKKSDEAKQSVSDMKKYLRNVTSYLQEVKQGNKEINEAWKEVRDTTIDSQLITTLEAIKAMILDDSTSKAENEKDMIAEKIQNYMDARSLDVSDEQTKIELNTRQRQMNEILGKITLTLSCHKNKGNTFNAVKSDCALGDSSFRESYKKALKFIRVDPEEQCQLRTGEDYITEEKMKTAWESWVGCNKTVKALCYMNNVGIMSKIEDQLRKQVTDPRDITDAVINNPKKREDSYDEIEEIVKKILAENPDIVNELPGELKRYVCIFREKMGQSPADIVKNLSSVAKSTLGRELQEDEVKNLDCSGVE